MTNKLVSSVFIIIGGAIAAVAFYFLFFSTDGSSLAKKGILWRASEAVEVGISRYYYMNCYLPSVHQCDAVDQELGYQIAGYGATGYNQGITTTDSKDPCPLKASSTSYYSTGWR